MKLPEALLLLRLAVGANACAWYDNCKCHDDVTGLQNDTVTNWACAEYQYGQGYYLENDHHSCWDKNYLNNCDWNVICQNYGAYHQVCWGKENSGKAGESKGFCGKNSVQARRRALTIMATGCLLASKEDSIVILLNHDVYGLWATC